MNERMLASIEKHGKSALGRAQLIAHLKGKAITQQAAIRAKCYECMGYFSDGVMDCEIPSCPLYSFHAYNAARRKVGITDSKALQPHSSGGSSK